MASHGHLPSDPRLVVVMITRNRAEEAARTVDVLQDLPERPRVIVVDNGSSDDTSALLARSGAEVIGAGHNLGAAGRNVGVVAADTPYVAFCDDDTQWTDGSLARAADLLDHHPDLGLICGRVLVGADLREDPVCTEMAVSPLAHRRNVPGVPILGFLACASMVRRSAFLATGGFEPRFVIGSEEELLALDLAAAGWTLAYVPDVIIHHVPSDRRDPRDRRRLVVRNALWVAWLRFPLPLALHRTRAALRRAISDATIRRGAIDALRGWRWVLRSRRPLPAPLASDVRSKETQCASVAEP